MLDLADSDTKLDNYEVYKIEGGLDQDNDCIVHIIVNAKPNATKYYWELRKINADFEEIFYYFTTDFMFDEEYIHLSSHDYEYDLVLFKGDEEIEGMSGYYIEYEELPQDIKDMLNEFIVKKGVVMREIKFRGYSKTLKKYIYGNLLEDDFPKEGSIYQIVNKTTDGRFDVEEASIGQYTGFKDRNGVEIYEGDILDYIGNENDYVSDFEDKDKKVVVEWWKQERNGWQLVFFNIKNEHSSLFPYMFYWLDDFHAKECEVVGNTYEEELKESKKMQNWEVLQKKISEMNKDAFITFAKEKLSCDTLRGMLDINVKCKRCKYKFKSPVDCKRLLLEDEYQPPKQEKWIVHRTLRTQNKEVYLCKKGIKTNYYICRIKDGYSFDGFTTDNNEKAECFSFDKATKIRDVLNDDRVGKQYLWVISKVEE